MTTPAMPPFRSKAAVKRAMVVGSRWVMDHPGSGERRMFTGTVVRMSTTSRWLAWDDEPDSPPTWIPVSDTTGWVIEASGYVEEATGVRLRLADPTGSLI